MVAEEARVFDAWLENVGWTAFSMNGSGLNGK